MFVVLMHIVSMQLTHALVTYANDDKANRTFGLMHCFNKLEDTEKWKNRPQQKQQKKQKTSSLDTPGSSSASVFDDEATSPSKVPTKRPTGNKRAKEQRANSSSTTGNSSSTTATNSFTTANRDRKSVV